MALGWGDIIGSFDTTTLAGAYMANAEQKVVYNEMNKKWKSNDCIVLDADIKEAKDLLSYLLAQKIIGFPFPENGQPNILKDLLLKFRNHMKTKASDFAKKNTNINSFVGNLLIDSILPNKVKDLENRFVSGNCRNVIEQIRLKEVGQILTKQASASETSVLDANEKEQYIYLGLGAIVLLVSLYIITKK